MDYIIQAEEHPRTLSEVTRPTLVRSPALRLSDDLFALVLSCRRMPRSVPMAWRPHFAQLRTAFQRSPSISLGESEQPHLVSNAPIPSEWVRNYQLQEKDGGLSAHTFAAIIQFGPGHVTDAHIEESAAATYGCLVKGEKQWEFLEREQVRATCMQMEGDTLYIPPGFIHRVTTVSNGAIIIGETEILPTSVIAFARHAASLQRGVLGGRRHDPELEARDICATLGIRISDRQEALGGTWYNGAATTAVIAQAAHEQGGTAYRNRAGRRRCRRVFSSRHSKRVRKAQHKE